MLRTAVELTVAHFSNAHPRVRELRNELAIAEGCERALSEDLVILQAARARFPQVHPTA